MKEKLQKIRESALAEIEKSNGLEKLNEVRMSILGKKGELTAVLKGMKDVAPEDRPKVGQWVNETVGLLKISISVWKVPAHLSLMSLSISGQRIAGHCQARL